MFFLTKNFLYINDYLALFTLLLFSVGLSLLILGFSYFLSFQNPDTEKVSVYECGFDPYEDSRNKFDIKFYIIAILFILFDLEAMFLFPWAVCLNQVSSLGFWIVVDFFFELVVGYIYIWKIGGLKWN